MAPVNSSLYQVNTRVWLGEQAHRLGRPATLDDMDDRFLDRVAELGFDWLWPLGVWQTGPAGRDVSRSIPQWRSEYLGLLPDVTANDICGSPFAIQSYTVSRDFGGDEALAQLRDRLRQRGLKLMLDFVPNHTALDHPWVQEHPEYYVAGTAADLTGEPQNYWQAGERIFAHGRDPYFPGWPDSLQLNYRSTGLRQAMTTELLHVASRCDGVRCDMAMLLLPDVIERTWGQRSWPSDGSAPVDRSFWLEALPAVRSRYPDFVFMAEVYWDLEWELQRQGFDYTYDKRLYDRLQLRDAEAVRGHLQADAEFQRKSVRFLENHDEPRAASAFPPQVHQAAAVIAFLTPGLRFIHEGQLAGRRKRVSNHLSRRPEEPVDPVVQDFYARLLPCLKLAAAREGSWQLLHCRPAWDENPTWERFIAFAWSGPGKQRLLAVVNYGPTQGQCYVTLPWSDLAGHAFVLGDRLSAAVYERDGNELGRQGLFLDVANWHYHVFDVRPRGE